ncbi:MAG: transporter substrate-binding domain-containing protein [Gammaproteobacteria bacterium]|nr:transporter substrate-binding domain-containing protein [Gammaproteobacteria bacterium]
MKLKNSLVLTIFITTVYAGFAVAKNQTIFVGTVEYPPLMGKKTGLATEIVKAAFKSQNIDVVYEVYPMSRIIWSVENSINVASVGSRDWIKADQDADKIINTTFYYTNMNLFYLKERFPNGFNYRDLSNLKPYSIGYIRGGSLTQLLENQALNIIYSATMNANVRLLEINRVDFIAATELGGWGALEKHSTRPLADFARAEQNIHTISGDILFPESQEQLKATFETGLKSIINSGQYETILSRYHKTGPMPRNLKDLVKHWKGL